VTARAVVAKGQAEHHAFDVMIEIDTDGHRSGVKPEAAALIEIAQILRDGGVALKGVMTHAGSSYELDNQGALAQLAEREASGCLLAARRLRSAKLPCPEVSVGSTPTALSAQTLSGVSEVRAGVYVFFDLVMVNVGVCTTADIALSVLTTVIGHQPDKGWAIVDAGWMAMSRDRGTARQKRDYGYGIVCGLDATPIEPFIVSAANQEHGIVSRADGAIDGAIERRFPIGARLRILPNHACATGAQFPHYHVLAPDGGVSIWSRFYGW
jgi:D-serine deaminase-like pyridoxal phosphate-dependent protein